MTTATLNGQIHATGGTTTIAAPGFGARLRHHREIVGLSQTRLAALAGINWSHISRMETGTRKPSHDVLRRMMAHLEMSVTERAEMQALCGLWPDEVPVEDVWYLL